MKLAADEGRERVRMAFASVEFKICRFRGSVVNVLELGFYRSGGGEPN